MTPDVSPDERNLPHRKRSFMQMLIDNPKESLDSVEVDEIGAVDDMDHDGMDHDQEDEAYGLGMQELEGGDAEDLGASEREEEEERGQPEPEAEAEIERDAEDDEYNLVFEDEMDPLRFAEEDENGKLPYEQFQRLEYEALAARKRKNLATRSTETVQAKITKQQDIFGASVDEIWDAAGFGAPGRRRRKGPKRKGRRRKAPGGLTPEINKKLGEANLLYATGQFDEAVEILKEVVRIAPNVADSYHTLGLLYDAKGDRKRALNFYMIAAHLTPKDIVLWKRLASWSMELGNPGQVIYCLQKAMRADPTDVDARWDCASLYAELNEFPKAIDCLEQLLALRPGDVEICKMVAKMRQKNGQSEQATQLLEHLIETYPYEADLSAVNLLAELHMANGAFAITISWIDRARELYSADQPLPLDLSVKAGICHAYLGDLESAERNFEGLRTEQVDECADLILEVGDAYLALGEHKSALRYYELLYDNSSFDDVVLWLKLAQCHMALGSSADAIRVYQQVIKDMPQNVETRLSLASLLCDSGRQNEAISLLVPPDSDATEDITTDADTQAKEQPWWKHGKVVVKLANIYLSQSRLTEFVDTLLPLLHESLYVESLNQKVFQKGKTRKRLNKTILAERVQWLEQQLDDQVFQGFRPVLSRNDMTKASRARRMLAKWAAEKEEKKAAALAAGLEWDSDEAEHEHEPEPVEEVQIKVSPLPNLLKDEEHYQLVLQVCKALLLLKRYWEALEIVHHILRIGSHLGKVKCDELRALGAQIAYKTKDVKYGYDCVRYMVQQRPYSFSMWNAYYQVVSRSEVRLSKHSKYMLSVRGKYPDCVPAMVICGHQYAMISQPQGALREYLQAYQVQPDDPFINLCIGVSFINLSLGFRLSNRNQTVLQGFAFLYNYQRLCKFNQESNYNLARAFHHVGLVQLAVNYYEKVLIQREKDCPLVLLPTEGSGFLPVQKDKDKYIGHCDLRREAAHNLHLIYKKSGALDLARQVLRDHCTF